MAISIKGEWLKMNTKGIRYTTKELYKRVGQDLINTTTDINKNPRLKK